jgi:hypothetical protein
VSRRRSAITGAVAAAIALTLSGLGPASARAGTDARLQGSFRMRGRVTFVDGVYGEHRGQRVSRTWRFSPGCATGVCQSVRLVRERGSRRRPDSLMLGRVAPGVYVGSGQFSIPLLCRGRLVNRGGLARETITVRITQVQTVGGTIFATGVSASYDNPSRTNLTRCRGRLGRDAATYSGRLARPLPGSA